MTDIRLRPEQRYALAARDFIGDALDLINGLDLRPARLEEGGAKVAAAEFSGAVFFGPELRGIQSDDEVYVAGDVFDLWPVNVRMFSTYEMQDRRDIATLHSLRSATAKQARGRVRRLMPRMLRLSTAHIERGGRGYTTDRFYGLRDDGVLVDITNVDAVAVYPVAMDVHRGVRAMAGMALYLEYSWTVRIRAVGSNFAIRIPTTPAGARKLLSLRDVPAGRERRMALRHWVSEHSRVVQSGNEEREVDVRAHLRGAMPFTWDDFEGVVEPSAYDRRRNQQR